MNRTLPIFFSVILFYNQTNASLSNYDIAVEMNEFYGDNYYSVSANGKRFLNWIDNSVVLGPLSYSDLENFTMNNPQGTSSSYASLAILGAGLLESLIDGDNIVTVDINYNEVPDLGFESITSMFLLNGNHEEFNAIHSYETNETRVFWPTQIHKEICQETYTTTYACGESTGNCQEHHTREFERVYEKAVILSKFNGENWVTIHNNDHPYLQDTKNDGGSFSIYANTVFTDSTLNSFAHKYRLEVREKKSCSLEWEPHYRVLYEMDLDSNLDKYYDRIPRLFYNKAQSDIFFQLYDSQ